MRTAKLRSAHVRSPSISTPTREESPSLRFRRTAPPESPKHAVEGLSESLAYELESQAIRVKLVEPGAMRNTNFGASGGAASQQAPVPDGYRRYFDHALGTMMAYPFPDTDEQAVAEAIYSAATDASLRLRYPVGPDIEEYARLRWSTSEDDYRVAMSRLIGQTAWRDMAAVPAE